MISKETFNVDINDRDCILVVGNESNITNAVVASVSAGFTIKFTQPIKEIVAAHFMIAGAIVSFNPVLSGDKTVVTVGVKNAAAEDVALGVQKLHVIMVVK